MPPQHCMGLRRTRLMLCRNRFPTLRKTSGVSLPRRVRNAQAVLHQDRLQRLVVQSIEARVNSLSIRVSQRGMQKSVKTNTPVGTSARQPITTRQLASALCNGPPSSIAKGAFAVTTTHQASCSKASPVAPVNPGLPVRGLLTQAFSSAATADSQRPLRYTSSISPCRSSLSD